MGVSEEVKGEAGTTCISVARVLSFPDPCEAVLYIGFQESPSELEAQNWKELAKS